MYAYMTETPIVISQPYVPFELEIMEDTPIEDKYLLATGTSFTFAPSFSQLLLVNYDYNNSDSLSLDELLNNKSDFIQNINFILKTNFSTLENAIELLEDVF